MGYRKTWEEPTLEMHADYDSQTAALIQEVIAHGSVQLCGEQPIAPELYRPKPQVDPAKRWSCASWERERVPRRFLSGDDQRKA